MRDRGLTEGLLLYEDSLNRFGIPRRTATDDEMDGWFEIDDGTVDHAEAAYQRWQAETKRPEPGVLPRIIDTRHEGPQAARPPRPTPRQGDGSLGDQPARPRLVEGALGD
ncbi:hypothetical protein [Oerskovia turbata]